MASKFVWLWLTLLYFPRHEAGRSRSKCNFYEEKCYNLTFAAQTTTLTCRQGTVLFAPSVRASLTSSEDCAGNTNCTGYQVNGLVLSNNCFWRHSCDIQYSKSPVIIMADDNSCLGRSPHTMKTRFMCIKSGDIITVGNRTISRPVTKKQGIIKSHEEFPWHFDRGMNGSLILKTKKKNRKLVITAYKADVDWEYDNIAIDGETRSIPITTETSNLGNISGSQIAISFHFSKHSRMVAEGFVFCFKWLKKNDNITDYNVCEKIQVCPRKKKHGHNGHRGNKGKRKRRNRHRNRQ